MDLASGQTQRFVGTIDPEMEFWGTATFASAACIAPLAPIAALLGFEELRYLTTGAGLAGLVMHAAPQWFVFSAFVLLFSAVLWAFIGKRYAGRFGLAPEKNRRWLLMGLMLGPAGILAMVTAHSCPARVRCAACNRRRVVTRETCEHCSDGFPAPAMNGTEILTAAAT